MKYIITIGVVLLFVISCSEKPQAFRVATEPTEEIINNLGGEDFSIVLNDMDIKNEKIKGKEYTVYKHKYHILTMKNDSLIVDSLDWKPVNEKFFLKYEKDLGMEIINLHNGTLSKVAQPVGHKWAIGNPKHGEWVADSTKTTNSSQNRYWRPHTSGLFWYWMLTRRTSYSNYNNTRSYLSKGRTYYGNTGTGHSKYGTNSSYQKTKRSSFFTRTKTNKSWNNYRKKTSKSSSRYSGSSKTRSRSGGFGK